MLKPAGTFSFAVGNLSGAAGIGGGAFGASLAAASLLAGRPINGDPGGSAGAAAGDAPAAGGDAAGCCAEAPSVNALRKTPASNRLRGADEWIIMGVLPWRKPVLYTRHMGVPTPVGFPNGNLDIFPSERNRKTASPKPRRSNRRPDTDRLHRVSVLRNRGAGGVKDRFSERKLQHDLAVVVGHLDDSTQQRAIGAVGLEQFPDHRACHFPGAIG